MDKIEELLTRGVEEVIERDHLEKRLRAGEKLRVKYGADPTRPDLHLGHVVGMRKLKILQDLGHHVIFVIGDFTAKIGDPSGRSKLRPEMSEEEIEKNAKTYFEQVGKILDISKIEIRKNSEWFSKISFDEVIKMESKFTIARTLERDDFEKRLKAGVDIGNHEILYPMMQAYDSLILNIDLEVEGNDQKFNVHAGRELQRKMGKLEQDILLVSLLVGLDGQKKMSKSLDNYIGIIEDSDSQYGKIMSIPDSLIEEYYLLLTDLDYDKNKNPRDAKMKLAYEIVKTFHGEKEAERAQENFVKLFQKKEIPDDIQEIKTKKETELTDILIENKFISSKSEFRQLVKAGAIDVDGGAINNAHYKIGKNSVVKIGKKKFVRITI